MADNSQTDKGLHEIECEERIQKYYELNLDEDNYIKNPSYLALLRNYLKFRALQIPPPDWLLNDLDKYLEMQLKNESTRRLKEGHQMTFHDYAKIVNSRDPASKKNKYAKEHNISLSAVEKRMRVVRDFFASIRSPNTGNKIEATEVENS